MEVVINPPQIFSEWTDVPGEQEALDVEEELKKYLQTPPPKFLAYDNKYVFGGGGAIVVPTPTNHMAEVMVALDRVTPPTLAGLKARALEWVNTIRGEWGYPQVEQMPKGMRANSTNCPMARALPKASSVNASVTLYDGSHLLMPQEVIAFMMAFDGGQYPELVEA